jgi:tetrahydromethanopterin S-methyltransferase subunit G
MIIFDKEEYDDLMSRIETLENKVFGDETDSEMETEDEEEDKELEFPE